MDIGKLFGVLVVGGALLTTGPGCKQEEESGKPDASTANVPAHDGGQDAMPDGADASSEELIECGFCPNDCCVTDEHGNSAAKEGFVCCWGTSC